MLYPNRRFAFTLIELLVVISLVSLLIALLLPAMRQARDVARSMLCQTQFRQLGQSFHMYAVDHSHALPRHAPSNPANDPLNEGWDIDLAPYLGGATFGKGHGHRPPPGSLMPHLHARDRQGVQFSSEEPTQRLKVYCPLWSYPMPFDRWGNRPGHPGSSSTVASWAFFRVGSQRMNFALSEAGQVFGGVPDQNVRLDDLASSVMILSEGYDWARFTNAGKIYFHPRHGDAAPMLFTDGRVELRGRKAIPWRGSSSAEGTAFWGTDESNWTP